VITAWSFSRLRDYEQCPFKAKLKYVAKLKEPDSPAMAEGSRKHKVAEDWLAGRLPRLPAELKELKDFYTSLRKEKPQVELELCFTSDWTVTGWFDKNAWLRVKVDAFVPPAVDGDAECFVVDHKSGKYKPDNVEYNEQLELYNLTALLNNPAAAQSVAVLAFMDHGVIAPKEPVPVVREQVIELQRKWEDRVDPMMRDKRFVPKQGQHCRWCHFRKSNNGPCEHG
jgi:CRISPR/Cas system-associated exonuclease Cas4 (RecB family)